MCRTRQTAVGKGPLCRVQYIEHTAKVLSCALADPRQTFLHGCEADVAGAPLPCALADPRQTFLHGCLTWRGTFAVCHLCLAHGKGSIFAVCLGHCTRQRLVPLPCAMVFAHSKGPLFFIFLFITYMVSQIIQTIHIYHNNHRMHFK